MRLASALAWAILAVVLVLACEPTSPPPIAGTPPPSVATSSGPAPNTSTVAVSGGVVEIIGAGNSITDEFELAPGTAEMNVSTCPSNQVIPFVTIYDVKDNKLGIIVDAVYQVKNLAGGGYYLEVAANPDCVWTITLTPN
jgi:hypothetical protein